MARHRLGLPAAVLLISLLLGLVGVVSGCGQAAPTQTPTSTPTATPTATTPAGKTIVWKLGHYFTTEDYRGKANKKWAELITARTGGRIKADVYPSQQLVKATESFSALAANVHQITSVETGYASGQIPLIEWSTIPFPPWDRNGMREMYQDAGIIERLQRMANKSGVYYVGLISTLGVAGDCFSRVPIRTLADFKGKKIRGTGGSIELAYIKAGSSMVTLSAADQYMALQTGTVDAAQTGHGTALSTRIFEVAPYWVNTGLVLSAYPGFINLSEWQALTPDLQKQVTDATVEAQKWAAADEDAYFGNLTGELNKVFKEHIFLTKEDMTQWRSLSRSVNDDMLKKFGDDGAYVATVWDKYFEKLGLPDRFAKK